MKGSKRVADQVELINSVDWDMLIILDDCRYDYFKEIYPRYIDGTLRKALSPASSTYGWCRKVLESCNLGDVVYISVNPYINSVRKIEEFDPRGLFHKIIDAWLIDWNDKISTVHPKDMTKRLRKSLLKYPERRVIAHYMQPHFPYLSLPPEILSQ